MHFRKATSKDIYQILTIIDQAKVYFKEQGIDQWQDGYPNFETISNDIQQEESYVLEIENKIIATAMITTKKDPNYTHIQDGNWLHNWSYSVIHRIAINPEYKGKNIASLLIKSTSILFPEVQSIRVDTHEDNHSMQRLLEKNGFVYCGIVYVLANAKRKAYEKITKPILD